MDNKKSYKNIEEQIDNLEKYMQTRPDVRKSRMTLDASLTEWAALVSTAVQVARASYKVPEEHEEAVSKFFSEYQQALTAILMLPPELKKVAMIPGMDIAKDSGF